TSPTPAPPAKSSPPSAPPSASGRTAPSPRTTKPSSSSSAARRTGANRSCPFPEPSPPNPTRAHDRVIPAKPTTGPRSIPRAPQAGRVTENAPDRSKSLVGHATACRPQHAPSGRRSRTIRDKSKGPKTGNDQNNGGT